MVKFVLVPPGVVSVMAVSLLKVTLHFPNGVGLPIAAKAPTGPFAGLELYNMELPLA